MNPNTPLITVSGRIASGTSTVAEAIADEYGLELISGGDIFRQQAKASGYTLAEYTELCEEDPSIDKDLDEEIAEIADRHRIGKREPRGNGLVIESRLAGWMAGRNAHLKIWLDAPLEDRLTRVTDREETVEEARIREESEAQRYMEYHGVDIQDRSVYDLVIDTSKWSEEMVVTLLTDAVGDRISFAGLDYTQTEKQETLNLEKD